LEVATNKDQKFAEFSAKEGLPDTKTSAESTPFSASVLGPDISCNAVNKAKSIPIVGIGASAGGLESVSELIAHLSASTVQSLVSPISCRTARRPSGSKPSFRRGKQQARFCGFSPQGRANDPIRLNLAGFEGR
jgi:hypothetical protein